MIFILVYLLVGLVFALIANDTASCAVKLMLLWPLIILAILILKLYGLTLEECAGCQRFAAHQDGILVASLCRCQPATA